MGGPDDGVIIPWQTTQWGYLAPTNASSEPSAMARMEDLPAYANDSFGLRALDQAGRLHRAVVPGVQHVHFLRDERVLKIIEPWLR